MSWIAPRLKAHLMKLKLKASLYCLINSRSTLCLNYMVILYNSVLKSIWTHDSQLEKRQI